MKSPGRVIVVMPAYHAEHTLRRTYEEVMEQGVVDLVIPAALFYFTMWNTMWGVPPFRAGLICAAGTLGAIRNF